MYPSESSVYEKYRKRSDLYIPVMNQMAVEILIVSNLLPIYFVEPTKAEDMRHGIDQHVVPEPVTLAHRTRANRYKNYYKAGFTLRYPNEVRKVAAGDYADYLLYAIEHSTEPGKLESGILIDMRQVGWQLRAYPNLLKQAKQEGDWIEFRYVDFPHDVVAGLSGIAYSDLEQWEETEAFVYAAVTGNSFAEHYEETQL